MIKRTKYNNLNYDELSKLVNEKFKTEQNIKKIATEFGISFSEVWEMVGLKDHFDNTFSVNYGDIKE